MAKRLTRSRTDRFISGVCGGLAGYLDMDPSLVRLLAVLVMFVTGVLPVVVTYVVAACIVPEEGAGSG